MSATTAAWPSRAAASGCGATRCFLLLCGASMKYTADLMHRVSAKPLCSSVLQDSIGTR